MAPQDPMQQMAQQTGVSLMLVTVPPNVRVGEQMVVMTPTGQQSMVVVPQGAGPGSQFQIAVPRDNAAPPANPMGGGYPPMGMPGNPMMQQPGMGGMYGAFDASRGRGMGGRGRGRKRKEKDPNRAPRAPSQYNIFMKTEVARVPAAA